MSLARHFSSHYLCLSIKLFGMRTNIVIVKLFYYPTVQNTEGSTCGESHVPHHHMAQIVNIYIDYLVLTDWNSLFVLPKEGL